MAETDKETSEKENVAPAVQAEAERFRLLQPAFDRFENRHFAGLAASIALHLAILMGLKWAIHPQPPKPMIVEVEMLPAEPVKASPHYSMAKAKPVSKSAQARQKIRPPKQPKPVPLTPDQEMSVQVVQAAPAKPPRRGVKGKGAAAPAVALPDASSPVMGTSRAIPGQAPAAATYQQADQQGAIQPRMASAGQQASSRMQTNPASGVESEKGPALIASNTPAAQTLSPEYRHSSNRGGQFSSQGGATQTAAGGGPRSEANRPYSLQASGSGSSSLPVRGVQNGARVSAPSATSVARAGGLAPAEIRSSGGQLANASGSSLSPDHARVTGNMARAASPTPAGNVAHAGGSTPTEIRSSGGQLATAPSGTVAPTQANVARGKVEGGAAGSAASADFSSGAAAGRGLPGEARVASGLQGSSHAGLSASSGRGLSAGDFSRPGGGSSRGMVEGADNGGQLLASAGSARSIGPAVSSMNAAIVPERGPAAVSRVTDDAGVSSMQRVDARAVAHQMDSDRYEAKSLKVNSPKTICELPLMMAGFDRKPLPEGLASIMGSESAMVMEAPPELLPGNLQPTYPPAALIGNLKGVVTLRAQVLTNGQVGEMFVRPPRAAGVLEQAAMETVRRWRFKPARRNGEPVPAWVNIPIEYRNPT